MTANAIPKVHRLPTPGLLDRLFPDRRSPLRVFPEAVARHGDILQLPAPAPTYLLSHPDHVKHVLQDNHLNYRHNTRQQISMGRESLALAEGEEWKRKRRLMQPLFVHQRLRTHAETMARGLAPAAERWARAAAAGQTIDVAGEMVHLTLDMLVHVLFGTGEATGGQSLERTVRTVFEYFNDRTSGRLSILPWVAKKRGLRFKQGLDMMKRAIGEVIERRRGVREEDGSLLTAFMVNEDPQAGVRQTDEQVLDEVMMLLVMGHMTTAMALTWTFALLARHPEWEQKVVAELGAAASDGGFSFDALSKLDVTARVLEESLRLYPPSWRFARRAVAFDEVGNLPVPAGATLILSPWVTHRRADLWPDPERFDPDRFLPAASETRHRFAYFPFGGGPRSCIAREMALIEIPLILGSLLSRVRLSSVSGTLPEPEPRITLEPKGGLHMKLSPR